MNTVRLSLLKCCNAALLVNRGIGFTQHNIKLLNYGRCIQPQRQFSSKKKQSMDESNMSVAYYSGALAIFIFGLAYASVPLYKVFCSMTGFGGTTQRADDKKLVDVKPVPGSRVVKVYFTADVHSEMPWKFKPTQSEVKLAPGETALAFYTVKNTLPYAVTGVATYNVFPPKAGLYFNKIQCFCFEEQRLGANEEIDMPVFFFIDPDFLDDPAMNGVNTITLSYTFFKTGDEQEEGDAVQSNSLNDSLESVTEAGLDKSLAASTKG